MNGARYTLNPRPSTDLATALAKAFDALAPVLVQALTPIITEEVRRQIARSPGDGSPPARTGHPDTGDYLMSVKQVAQETTISPGTLRQWRSTGKGPESFNVGGRVVYKRSVLDRWLADQESTPRSGL